MCMLVQLGVPYCTCEGQRITSGSGPLFPLLDKVYCLWLCTPGLLVCKFLGISMSLFPILVYRLRLQTGTIAPGVMWVLRTLIPISMLPLGLSPQSHASIFYIIL